MNATATATTVATTQPVVSNDTSATATNMGAQGITVTIQHIESLVLEREMWEQNAYRTSNEQLYALLGKCYGYYKALGGDSDEAKALRDGLDSYINTRAYQFAKSTHTITKIVKCVFGVDRRRVSAYSIVLRSALAKNISTMDIAAYIRDNGGVEEIRLAKSSTGKSPKEKAQATATVVDGNDLGTIGSAALSAMLDSGKVGSNTVLIGTWQANGTVVVRAVVESDTALTAALASHYASVKEQADKAAKAAKEKEAADAAKSAIDAAATSATVTAQ